MKNKLQLFFLLSLLIYPVLLYSVKVYVDDYTGETQDLTETYLASPNESVDDIGLGEGLFIINNNGEHEDITAMPDVNDLNEKPDGEGSGGESTEETSSSGAIAGRGIYFDFRGGDRLNARLAKIEAQKKIEKEQFEALKLGIRSTFHIDPKSEQFVIENKKKEGDPSCFQLEGMSVDVVSNTLNCYGLNAKAPGYVTDNHILSLYLALSGLDRDFLKSNGRKQSLLKQNVSAYSESIEKKYYENILEKHSDQTSSFAQVELNGALVSIEDFLKKEQRELVAPLAENFGFNDCRLKVSEADCKFSKSKFLGIKDTTFRKDLTKTQRKLLIKLSSHQENPITGELIKTTLTQMTVIEELSQAVSEQDLLYYWNEVIKPMAQVGLGLAPVTSFIIDTYSSLTGKDLFTGEVLGEFDHLLAILGMVTLGYGKKAAQAFKFFGDVLKKTSVGRHSLRVAEKIYDSARKLKAKLPEHFKSLASYLKGKGDDVAKSADEIVELTNTKKVFRETVEHHVPHLGGFKNGIAPNEILNINKNISAGVFRPGFDAKTITTNATRYEGFWNKTASMARDIVKSHAFVDGNKRTASSVINLLKVRNGISTGVSQEAMKKVLNRVATGELKEIKDIAKALRGF